VRQRLSKAAPFMLRSKPAAHAAQAGARLPARVFLFAVSLFIVYGSLFPFDFAADPLPLASFFAEHDLFANQSDAIDNFFLFVPLGVALHASFARPAGRAVGALLSVLVLALGIQLVQLYLPSRTASISDAVWNTAGMAAGLLVAGRVRAAFAAQLAARAGGRDNFLLGLVLVWLFYESFPFMPTLDVGLLRAHVKTVVFAPPFEPMRMAQHALAAAIAAIAVVRSGWLRRPGLGLLGLGALALALEVCVAYGSLRRETLLGIVAGLGAGYLAAQATGRRVAGLALVLALAAYVFTVLTPYRGQALGEGFTLTPFSHLLWNGALRELPPAAFEALAIGAMLWAGLRLMRGAAAPWCVLVLVLLAVLEWVRVELVGYHGDTTALVMALVLAPCAAALRLAHGTGPASFAPAPVDVAPDLVAARPRLPLLGLGASAAVLTFAMWTLVRLPGIPYNLAKLFGGHPLGGAAVFSLALLWIGGGAWLAARAVLYLDGRRRAGVLWLPLLLAGIALVSYVLVDFATPEIMLNKMVGAPDLYRRIVDENYWGDAWQLRLAAWPRGLADALERVVRYCALYSVFMIALVVGLLAVPRAGRRARAIAAAAWLLPFWVLAKFVVLDWAITDNLDELVTEGGSLWLGALLALFGANVALVAAGAGRARRYPVLALATAALAGAGWFLFDAAIESVVINNGRVFNGVQFLLGENRVALLPAWALCARWCALYLGAVVVASSGVLLAMRALPAPVASVKRKRARVPRAVAAE
jgi:VanZ family protein